jgi:hypothetical protein
MQFYERLTREKKTILVISVKLNVQFVCITVGGFLISVRKQLFHLYYCQLKSRDIDDEETIKIFIVLYVDLYYTYMQGRNFNKKTVGAEALLIFHVLHWLVDDHQ